MIKKIVSLTLALTLSMVLCTAYAYDPFNYNYYDNWNERPYNLQINGEGIVCETPPTSVDGVTYAQTDILADKLYINATELESIDIDGIMMSPIRSSADKKGWNTYWENYSKTVFIIDTESLRNDFKWATSNYLDLIKKIMKIPENAEYSFTSSSNINIDGGDNGFIVYTKGDIVGALKLEKDKIAGSFNVKYDGLNKLIWMITSGMMEMPYMPLDFSYYIDDSGIYLKSPLVSMIYLSDYRISDEFKNKNMDKWIKIGFDELEIEGLDQIDKIRNFDADYAIDCLVNTVIFGSYFPKDAYVHSSSYDNWKEKVETIVELKPNNYVKSSESGITIEFTKKDFQWALEKFKENITTSEYYNEEESAKNIELLERFIESIDGGLKTDYIFENDYLKSINSDANFKMIVPFYFDQTISNVDIAGNGIIEIKNIGTTVITETVPAEYITQKQVQESYIYQYDNFHTPENDL